MIKYCLGKWDKNRGILKHALEERTDLNSCCYFELVEMIVTYILNDGRGKDEQDVIYGDWDVANITEIDDGSYQGTLLYLIPRAESCPSESDYLMTYIGYGSCCVCDTLQSIQEYGDGKLTSKQVKEFMSLCKDIVTNMIKPYNNAWREEPEFETVEMLNESEHENG